MDKTPVQRYALWAWNIVSRGHLGRSFQWEKPVTEVIGERIALTMTISLFTLIFVWVVAIPIGIYAAIVYHRANRRNPAVPARPQPGRPPLDPVSG